MRLCAARPFAVITIEEICAAADVARGTFFLHFRGKAALREALDRDLARALRARLGGPRGSALSELRVLAEVLVAQPPRACLAPAPTRRDREQPAPSPLHELAEEVVRRGQRRGELRRNVSARLAAVLLISACDAVGGDPAARGGPTAEARNEILHAVLHGLAEPKPRLKWRAAGVAPAR
ncbi:MAG: TetR/AcrR family transcriptional regulator, partial [Myxococcales bacterium]|nr:TetR/AcrR family transcriptional regulator [Myxococcales bacterium]